MNKTEVKSHDCVPLEKHTDLYLFDFLTNLNFQESLPLGICLVYISPIVSYVKYITEPVLSTGSLAVSGEKYICVRFIYSHSMINIHTCIQFTYFVSWRGGGPWPCLRRPIAAAR